MPRSGAGFRQIERLTSMMSSRGVTTTAVTCLVLPTGRIDSRRKRRYKENRENEMRRNGIRIQCIFPRAAPEGFNKFNKMNEQCDTSNYLVPSVRFVCKTSKDANVLPYWINLPIIPARKIIDCIKAPRESLDISSRLVCSFLNRCEDKHASAKPSIPICRLGFG